MTGGDGMLLTHQHRCTITPDPLLVQLVSFTLFEFMHGPQLQSRSLRCVSKSSRSQSALPFGWTRPCFGEAPLPQSASWHMPSRHTPVVADPVGKYWAELDAIVHIEVMRQRRPFPRPDANSGVREEWRIQERYRSEREMAMKCYHVAMP